MDPSKPDVWAESYAGSAMTGLATFVHYVKGDIDAIKNAINSSFSNGLVEGFYNKLKAVKRGMYGRAGYSLLSIKLEASVTG